MNSHGRRKKKTADRDTLPTREKHHSGRVFRTHRHKVCQMERRCPRSPQELAEKEVEEMSKYSLRHGSLFSGIGGFDIAAENLGWTNIFQVEKDPFCQAVLRQHWPDLYLHDDVHTFNPKPFINKVDIITGGFPCQPFSVAGRQNGDADDRYLWPVNYEIIKKIKPKWVVPENVSGILTLEDGRYFRQVTKDLEAAGYTVFRLLFPAAGIGARHLRKRIWWIAVSNPNLQRLQEAWEELQTKRLVQLTALVTNAHDLTRQEKERELFNEQVQRRHLQTVQKHLSGARSDSDPNSQRFKGRQTASHIKGVRTQTYQLASGLHKPDYWRDFPSQSPVCRGTDGVPNRMDRIKALGNAIVPQVAIELFKIINLFHQKGV